MARRSEEGDFQGAVLDLAAAHGWTYRYHTFDSRRSTAGFPDLVLMRPPELLVVELKAEKGRTSREQEAWLEAFRACGVTAFVWRPSDWKIIEAALRRSHANRS